MITAIGLDLSLTNTGIAVVSDRDRLQAVRSVKTIPKDGSRIERCDYIATVISDMVLRWAPHLIIIEDYAHSRPTNQSTLGELGGIVKLALWRTTRVSECWMTVVASECVKHITGSGGGTRQQRKERMIEAAQPYYDHIGLLSSDPARRDDNIADAVGLARYGFVKFSVS